VKSITLDGWDEEQIRVMRVIGNTKANRVWEAHIPNPFIKPTPTSPITAKQEWVQAKYELGLFKKTNQLNDEDEEEDEQSETKEDFEWREAISPDGRKYYWNKKTKERRWKKPEPQDPDLPENWKQAQAPNGKKYYYNVETKERRWKKPSRDSFRGLDVEKDISRLQQQLAILEVEEKKWKEGM